MAKAKKIKEPKVIPVPCSVCGATYHREGGCPGVREYRYDKWPSGLLTERQLTEKHLIAGASGKVGAIWYMSKRSDGHWLWLYRESDAVPKPVSDAKRAALEKAKATALRNRTCAKCGRDVGYKIKDEAHICNDCLRLARCIATAQSWLVQDAVIVDTETTGLGSDGEVISITVINMAGTVLYSSLVMPTNPVDERIEEPRDFETGRGYWDERWVPTAYAINGISNEMLVGAPSFSEMWAQVKPLLENKLVLAYNADFDMNKLDYGCARHKLEFTTSKWDCVMLWYAEFNGDWNNRHHDWRWIKLGEACYELEITIDEANHTARGDCVRTLELIKKVASIS